MGTWRITIEGHGCHHNSKDTDANEMAKKFVNDLKGNSHEVSSAKFELTSSCPVDDLTKE